jgi:hypothetical protein
MALLVLSLAPYADRALDLDRVVAMLNAIEG